MKKVAPSISSAILPYFVNGDGIKVKTPAAVKTALLRCLKTSFSLQNSPLPQVKVLHQQRRALLRLNNPNAQKSYHGKWLLTLEQGQRIEGKIKKDKLQFPDNLPLGYHLLRVEIAQKYYECSLIVAPMRAYQPKALSEKQKLWGTFLQLYSLKSEQNWGVGDFGDLKQFISKLHPFHADFIGLNPIHALFPANPEAASPYSPSSRKWLNFIYIDVNQLPEFHTSSQAQAWFKQDEIQQKLAQLRTANWVNYAEIAQLKLTALRFAFAEFCQNTTACSAEFTQFMAQGGKDLLIQATFDALHSKRMAEQPHQWGWDCWAHYADYTHPAISQFQAEEAELVRFYAWLQFIAAKQLADCDALCQSLQMPIGLYRDLAVGVSANGAETWGDKTRYCLNVAIGAPPDELAPQGQNWGLTPFHPHILQQQAYRPFIELIRANMQHCGALRIDHIMSLLRLWWIPKKGAHQGGYVRYPVDDLIAILALESQRQQCLIIGEDLGTVPKEIVQKLQHAGILSYKIFYFEFDSQGKSRALASYPYQAMTTLSTHDLPTLRGYWQGDDFELGKQFGVYPSAKIFAKIKQSRIEAKTQFLARLRQAPFDVPAEISASFDAPFSKAFSHQLQCYVAQVNSALFGFQPEDWLDMREPVNIPGTSTEYPNWRRKLSHTVTEMFADADVVKLLHTVNQQRKGR